MEFQQRYAGSKKKPSLFGESTCTWDDCPDPEQSLLGLSIIVYIETIK